MTFPSVGHSGTWLTHELSSNIIIISYSADDTRYECVKENGAHVFPSEYVYYYIDFFAPIFFRGLCNYQNII